MGFVHLCLCYQTIEVDMTYNWCHAPKCHENFTLDRIRGSKGNKVLRTRKIALNNWNKDWWTKYFCSQGCCDQYINTHLEAIVSIAPRREPLETPIKDPVKDPEMRWNSWTIEKKVG